MKREAPASPVSGRGEHAEAAGGPFTPTGTAMTRQTDPNKCW